MTSAGDRVIGEGLRWRWRDLPLVEQAGFAIYVVVLLISVGMTWDAGGGLITAEAFSQTLESGSLFRRGSLMFLGLTAIAMLLRMGRARLAGDRLVLFVWAGFLATALLSVVWSSDPGFTLRRVSVLLILATAALAFARAFGLRGLAWLTLLVSGGLAALGLLHSLAHASMIDSQWRFGGVVHPVNQGWHLGLMVLAGLALARWYPRHRRVFNLLVLAALVLLVLTRTRAVLGATLVAVVFFQVVAMRKRPLMALAMVGLGGAATAALVVLIVVGTPSARGGIADSFASALSFGREDAQREALTLTNRTPLWSYLVEEGMERPLLGHGYNTYFGPDRVVEVARIADWGVTSAHSAYIEAFLGLGWIGLSLYLLTLLVPLVRTLTQRAGSVDGAFGAAILMWILVVGLLEAGISTDPILPTLSWMIVVSCVAFEGRGQRPSRGQRLYPPSLERQSR